MRTEQPVQNLPLSLRPALWSSNIPFSGLSFLPVSQEPSLAWTLSTQSPQKRHLSSHWTQGVGGSLSVFSGPQCAVGTFLISRFTAIYSEHSCQQVAVDLHGGTRVLLPSTAVRTGMWWGWWGLGRAEMNHRGFAHEGIRALAEAA